MKTLAISMAILLMPAVASAQGYIEGSIGMGFISSADVQVVNGPTSADRGTIGLDYGSSLIFGAEAGFAGLGNTNSLRLGASWDHAKADLDTVKVSGFGTGGAASISCSLLESEIDVSCSNLNSTVNVFAGNAYLDLGMGNAMGIQPYIGVGAGFATFKDAKDAFAMSGTLGARYPLSMNAYVGGRYRFQWIDATKNDESIQFDSIKIHGISLLLGVTF